MDRVALLLPGLHPRCFCQIFIVEFVPLLADLQLFRHKARDSIVILLIDLPVRSNSILIHPFRSLRLDPALSIPIRKIPPLLIPFPSHKRHHLAHPRIPIHKLPQPSLLPVEGHRIIEHTHMQLRQVQLIHLLVQVVGLPLACIVKLWAVLVGVEIAVLADKSMGQFEGVWGLLADPVGLARVGADTQRVWYRLPSYHELKDVALLHTIKQNQTNGLAFPLFLFPPKSSTLGPPCQIDRFQASASGCS